MSETSGKTETHFLSNKDIVVAGAGLAGLAFIRHLHRTWPTDVPPPRITLYERRAEKLDRDREGYSIGLRSDPMSGGMQALKKIRLLDDALKNASVKGDGGDAAFHVWDAQWNKILKFKTPPQPPDGLPFHSMRITRYELRRCMIKGLPEGTNVRWGIGLEGAERLHDGRMRVMLSDGSSQECDLLIAADGANSKVRASLTPDDKLRYAGAVMMAGNANFPQGIPEPFTKSWGLVLTGDGHALFVSPLDDKRATWGLSSLRAEPVQALRGAQAQGEKENILSEVQKNGHAIAEPWPTLIEATEPSTLAVLSAMDKLPTDHSKIADTPVIFIGDSSHAVSPFAGNGANMAIMDGIDLAEALRTSESLATARTSYEKQANGRSSKAVKVSHITIAIAHATGWKLWFYKFFLHIINFLMGRG